MAHLQREQRYVTEGRKLLLVVRVLFQEADENNLTRINGVLLGNAPGLLYQLNLLLGNGCHDCGFPAVSCEHFCTEKLSVVN